MRRQADLLLKGGVILTQNEQDDMVIGLKQKIEDMLFRSAWFKEIQRRKK